MAIEASEFMKDLRISRAGIDPQEKLRQWQELKKKQFAGRRESNGPFLMILKDQEK